MQKQILIEIFNLKSLQAAKRQCLVLHVDYLSTYMMLLYKYVYILYAPTYLGKIDKGELKNKVREDAL